MWLGCALRSWLKFFRGLLLVWGLNALGLRDAGLVVCLLFFLRVMNAAGEMWCCALEDSGFCRDGGEKKERTRHDMLLSYSVGRHWPDPREHPKPRLATITCIHLHTSWVPPQLALTKTWIETQHSFQPQRKSLS